MAILTYRGIYYPALSPDGRSVALEADENSNLDIWIHETARTGRTRISDSAGPQIVPVWSPGGNEIAFSSYQAGNIDIVLRQADGSGEEEILAATPYVERISDWSRDGKYILFSLKDPRNDLDLWYLESKDDGWEAHPFLQTRSAERAPKLSPDGRYVAYTSDESGRREVYVRPFPGGDHKWPVSGNGGAQPRWSRDGKELFYGEGTTLMAVSVSTSPGFSRGTVTRLFEHPKLEWTGEPHYDVSLDGEEFVVAQRVGAAPNPTIHLVQNWLAEFRGR